MTDIKTFTFEQLKDLGAELGWQRFRAQQIFLWLWQKHVTTFDQMTNLSKEFRARLAERFFISNLVPIKIQKSADKTTKFTFRLSDGNVIESVLLFDQNRRTVCVSTQVGCGLGCRFCATARMGFKRNLYWHEIVEQIQAIIRETKIMPTNVVFMGMGEPLLNWSAVVEAVKAINSNYGLKIGARRITISTAGIPEGIRKVADFPLQLRLAISLNATTDKVRSQIMPINNRYPLKTIFPAILEYIKKTKRRVTFEYVLIDGVNDRDEDGKRLIARLKNIPCKINLIPFNPFPGSEFRPPSPRSVEKFARALYPFLPAVTIRKSKGTKILAGCGQLACPLPGSPSSSFA